VSLQCANLNERNEKQIITKTILLIKTVYFMALFTFLCYVATLCCLKCFKYFLHQSALYDKVKRKKNRFVILKYLLCLSTRSLNSYLRVSTYLKHIIWCRLQFKVFLGMMPQDLYIWICGFSPILFCRSTNALLGLIATILGHKQGTPWTYGQFTKGLTQTHIYSHLCKI